ncbi:MAG: amidohydrolase family protein, partial [Planctomycetota bacterium]|nr:amidohydrolase family protein [Planctomycetota bacterium]
DAGARLSSDPSAGVIVREAFHALSLEVNRLEERGYPNSKMGAIALVRQCLSDAPWQVAAEKAAAEGRGERPAPDASAAALAKDLPLLFDVEHEQDVLRAGKIAREFGRRAMVVGCGTELRRLEAVVAERMPLILPLAFAEKPEVGTLADRESLDLRQLMLWEASPTNAARLDRAGARVALTSSKLPKDQKFMENLREAVRAGLSEERALAMLTVEPARMLGIDGRYGRVAPGMSASLVVMKGALLGKESEVRDVWIDGVRHEINAAPRVELEGRWAVRFEGVEGGAVEGTLKVGKKNEVSFERPVTEADRAREAAAKEKAERERAAEGGEAGGEKAAGEGVKEEGEKAAGEKADEATRTFKARMVSVDENRVDLVLDGEALGVSGAVSVSAMVGEELRGFAELPGGARAVMRGTRSEGAKAEEAKDDADAERYAGVPERFGLPFGPYGLMERPASRSMVLTARRVWTSGPAGIIENGVLAVHGGKVVYVGGSADEARGALRSAGGDGSGAEVVDLGDMEITPGLIDCHSHTGIAGGVNEGTQSCTSEVRIFDVIDPDAIGWYRELAGGLTAANQLHGSANAIGGQNSVVKLRWGVAHPDEMRIEGAPAGIKFALGENVKQSNWGDRFSDRYPQTRMGVETYIRDRFVAAREYAAERARSGSAAGAGAGARRDLELEALAEILAGERLVHCHSYRQDEILMLCRVAKEFGFKIGTFQHVLEGYKVAEAIREQAIGGSAFSDWWAYKFEVVDAIPHAGAIMHDAGVVVSFNSDSDELARRMNGEAAKAVKYGGVDPAEALKFVTLNPAKQLKIDGMTGSLEVGKDADFVVWSGSPLSSMSRCERTFVDGREMFSLERDRAERERIRAERERIVQKLLAKPKEKEKKEGAGEGGPKTKPALVPDEPAPTGLMSGGRGAWLSPVGEDIDAARELAARRALERNYEWLVRNGLDPRLQHVGDCGCSAACVIE